MQDDWVNPGRAAWVASLERQILDAPRPVVLAAHSLGCIAVTHLAGECVRRVHGALLVAPADPDRRSALNDFAPVPCERLPYRSIVVASTDDPCCPSRRAGAYARAWGSEFVRLPEAGATSTSNPVTATGRWGWPCCSR